MHLAPPRDLARRLALAAALLAFCAGFALAGSGRSADDPLRLEDVVRLHVAGTSAVKIEEQIRAAAVDFDLADEMLEELRLAGIPPRVIAAMQQRQLELHPPAVATSAAEEAPADSLSVRFAIDRGDAAAPLPLRALNVLGDDTVRSLQLPQGTVRFDDLAIYVTCLTATHVPDHWRTESPLGRDFVSMARHRMLAFVPGAKPDEAYLAEHRKLRERLRRLERSDGPDSPAAMVVLALELPQSVEIVLEPGASHDLSVGLAIRVADRWYRLASHDLPGYAADDEVSGIDVVIEPALDLDVSTIVPRFAR